METKKFKKKFLGGFDKTEVIDYIDRLQKDRSEEYDEQKYIEEIERLKKERDALASALEKANEHLKKLSDPIAGSNSTLASSISHSKSHFESMAALSDEVRRETGENLSLVSSDADKLLENAVEMKKSFDAAAEKLNKDIENLRFFLEKSSPFFRGDPAVVEKIRQEAVKEDNSAKEVLKQGQKLLDETTAKQTEIDNLLEIIKKAN